MEFCKTTLANGLEIVAECNADASSTALGFFVKTGSRDETDEVAGVSHFLEHMVFKGTPKPTAADVNRDSQVNISDPIYLLGALYLGTTTIDAICELDTGPRSGLDAALCASEACSD